MQEVISRRTRNSKHFDLGNGQYRAEITLHDQHYHDGKQWQDVITDWEFEKGFGHKVKKANHNVRIFANKLRFGFDVGVFCEYTLPIEPNESHFVGNTLKVSNAWYNSDLEYTVTPEGIKGDIVLKDKGHPMSFSFPMNCTNCTAIQIDNRVQVFDKKNIHIGNILEPYLVDANGEIGKATLIYNGSYVILEPDGEWLATATYPVRLDPTTTLKPDGALGKDTYVNGGTSSVNTNFGASTQSSLGYLASGYQVLRTLQQYDYTGINGTINSAYFKYYVYQVAYLDTSRFVEMHYVNASWDEMTVTWNNKPATTLYAQQTFKVGASAGWKTIDNTSMVQEFINGTKQNYGFMLKGSNDDAGTSNQLDRYYSSDEATNVTLRPYQEIIYTPSNNGGSSVFGNINKLGRSLVA